MAITYTFNRRSPPRRGLRFYINDQASEILVDVHGGRSGAMAADEAGEHPVTAQQLRKLARGFAPASFTLRVVCCHPRQVQARNADLNVVGDWETPTYITVDSDAGTMTIWTE